MPFLLAHIRWMTCSHRCSGKVRRLEDGPHAHGEWLAAFVALVKAKAGGLAFHLANALRIALPQCGQTRTMRPKPALRHTRKRRLRSGNAVVGKNGVGHGEISYGLNPTSWGWYVKCNIAQKCRKLGALPPRQDDLRNIDVL